MNNETMTRLSKVLAHQAQEALHADEALPDICVVLSLIPSHFRGIRNLHHTRSKVILGLSLLEKTTDTIQPAPVT